MPLVIAAQEFIIGSARLPISGEYHPQLDIGRQDRTAWAFVTYRMTNSGDENMCVVRHHSHVCVVPAQDRMNIDRRVRGFFEFHCSLNYEASPRNTKLSRLQSQCTSERWANTTTIHYASQLDSVNKTSWPCKAGYLLFTFRFTLRISL